MAEPLPKWEMKRFAILWGKLGTREFTNKQAQSILKEVDNHILSVFFHNLKKAGWVEIRRDEKDQRKKIYILKEPNQTIKEMAK